MSIGVVTKRFMIAAVALAAGLALGACGSGSPTTQANSEPATARATDPETGRVTIRSTQSYPDWLFFLRTNDGGMIYYNQRTITRGQGQADIWLQVRYGRPQVWQYESESTITTVRYELERVHYRFDCTEPRFMIIERQIMGSNDEILGRQEPPQVWRPVQPDAGAAPHARPIACLAR